MRGRNRFEVFPDLGPNSLALELLVKKPKRNGNRGEAHQGPEKIKKAFHRSPPGIDGRAAMRAPSTSQRPSLHHACPYFKGEFEKTGGARHHHQGLRREGSQANIFRLENAANAPLELCPAQSLFQLQGWRACRRPRGSARCWDRR